MKQDLRVIKLLVPVILGVFSVGLIAESVTEQLRTSDSVNQTHLFVQLSDNTNVDFNWISPCPIKDPFAVGYSGIDTSCVGTECPTQTNSECRRIRCDVCLPDSLMLDPDKDDDVIDDDPGNVRWECAAPF